MDDEVRTIELSPTRLIPKELIVKVAFIVIDKVLRSFRRQGELSEYRRYSILSSMIVI